MRRLRIGLAAGGALAIVVLSFVGRAQSDAQQLWRHRNVGKALFETPTTISEAPAELKKALDLAPDSFRDRLNYGLALLRAGDLKTAIAELEQSQKQDPRLPHTWFNLGIAYKRERRYPEATRQFERMIELVPDEPVSHYNLGLLYKLAGRNDDARKQFETAAKIDPRLVAPKFQIYNFYRLREDEAAADRALKEFEEAKQQQQVAGETEDMDWCFYAELYDPSQAHPPARDASTPPPPAFEDRKLAGIADPNTAGMLVIDAHGSGKPDLLVWSRRGISLYRGGVDPIPNTGLETIGDVVGVAAGDFDNDGLTDLCVLTGSGAAVYRNRGGTFERVRQDMPAGHYESALWLDFDHDYDLDLLLLGETSRLLRNEGAAGFRDYTSHIPFAAGRALAATAFHVVPDSKGIDIAVSYAGRAGVLYRDELRGIFKAEPLDAVAANATMLRAADIDNDGFIDLAFRTPRGISVALNRDGKFEARVLPASGPLVFADLENRGMVDLVAGGTILRNQGVMQFAKAAASGLLRAAALAQADFDFDGRPDLAAVAPDGTMHLLLNRTPSANSWVQITLTGVKNVKTAASAEVEIKAGDHYQKQIYEGVPLLFGLGARKTIDTVRISWPNGMVQNQANEPVGRSVALKEAPRLAGSCPMIFTWNGLGFQFITDVLGVAPLGASSGDGDYFAVDDEEYVSIPGEALAPRGGLYDIRITEELHEVSYLDQVELIALDHPAALEVFTNEKFKSPPLPAFRLFGVSKRLYPIAAHDSRGRDVRPGILVRDRVYARGFQHNAAGVAEPHSLTLDFGPDAARNGSAVLLLNGWVDWADGSTFAAASQSGRSALVMPYLQVKDTAGKWQTVIEDMGIPAGKPKTIAVDLTGKFLSRSREIRISTNLCVYWDEIFLSENTAAPPVRLTHLAPASADLRLRGFSRPVIDTRREQPESFEYASVSTDAPWNQTPGLYTRYGDVRELVDAVDDRLVLMGAGDELSLRFDARALPPLAPGWRRDFLLLVDGWAKDADANTAFSQTVEPLPFHAMSRYPYGRSERFPDDAAHRAWRARYNTRPALRLIEPLTATGGPTRGPVRDAPRGPDTAGAAAGSPLRLR